MVAATQKEGPWLQKGGKVLVLSSSAEAANGAYPRQNGHKRAENTSPSRKKRGSNGSSQERTIALPLPPLSPCWNDLAIWRQAHVEGMLLGVSHSRA